MDFQSRRASAAALYRTLALAALAAFAFASGPAAAQGWPERPVTLIVPFPAGGGTDAFARPLSAQLDKQLGVRVLIDNRGGAGGTIGASAAAKAEPNGYTFFVGAAHHAIAPSIFLKLDYDIEKDFIPVALIAAPPQVIVVNPSKVEAKTLAEFIAYLKANPGKVDFASAGRGTTHQLAGELFNILAGTKMNHVPYRGAGPAMQDLVSGHVHVMFDGLGSSANQIQGGTLRALAVAAPQRSAAVPNVPTAAEAGLKGYEVSTWYALFAPKGTPPEVIKRMSAEVRKALDSEPIKEMWAKNGSAIPTLMGPEFGKFVAAEVVRWRDVVQKAGIKPE
ncbi:tripartite tricarboxylate transporter substrate binding protein [Bradyrhizobium sediminis]|uniref:Tripartite tricarboxylate transporter substrate binding protein n=1 Tax=Bradyrhizobium sediminis TaxID=2840469 RepID=A0A975NKN1_9BRAD|nr:tripartite tricarboxylate transporter substrate binding protein [Bradyrhizobium sediminis]QWG16585.1 tripartite tricarboxylate transporter substrate binding protein [Bradyrhizobium sediminis]